MSDVTLQLTVQSKSRAFVIGMCYRLRLGKLLCEKCALTIAMKYLFKKKKKKERRVNNETAVSISAGHSSL